MTKRRSQSEEQGATKAPKRRVNELIGELGTITFTENVLRGIVHHAVAEIEGLGEVKGRLTDIVSVFGGRQKGIQIELQEEGLKVSMNVAVRYGKPIHEVARRIQKQIKEELERMTGLIVQGVDIYVQDVQPSEGELAPEIEEEEGED